jgi:hypothetical protein
VTGHAADVTQAAEGATAIDEATTLVFAVRPTPKAIGPVIYDELVAAWPGGDPSDDTDREQPSTSEVSE